MLQKIPQNSIAKEGDIVWVQDYHQTVPVNELLVQKIPQNFQTVPVNEFFVQKIPQNSIAKEEDIEVWDEKMRQQLKQVLLHFVSCERLLVKLYSIMHKPVQKLLT